MKLKKLLATAMAAVMAVTMIPASAKADTIEGGSVYIDTEVYNVVLPTTATMKFYLDPQGLTSMDEDGNIADDKKGQIVANTASMSAINKSSVPVGLEMSYAVTGGGISVKNDATSVDDTGNDVAVSVTADMGTQYTTGGVWDTTGTVDITSPGAITATPTFAGTTGAPEEVTYIMGAADYDIEYNGKTDEDKFDSSKYSYVYEAGTGSEIKLMIGGACSKDGDWSGLPEETNKLRLEAIFKFVKVDTTDPTNVSAKTEEVGAIPTLDGSENYTIDYQGAWTSLYLVSAGGTKVTTGFGTQIEAGYFILDTEHNKFTLSKALLTKWKTLAPSSGYGPGLYTININGTDYKFNLQ